MFLLLVCVYMYSSGHGLFVQCAYVCMMKVH
jgi:hypothetical protein